MSIAPTERPNSAEPNDRADVDRANVDRADVSNGERLDQLSDSIASGVIFAVLLTVGQRIVGFVRGIIFCRVMSDQELGQWSMVFSFLMLLAPLAVLGLPGCFGRYTEHYRHRGQLRTFIWRIAIVTLTMTGAFSLAMLLAPRWFSWVIFRDPTQVNIVMAMAVSLLVVSASNFLSSLMESLRQVKAVTLMRFIMGMSFSTVGTAMIIVMNDRASAATLGYGVSCILGSIPAIWFLWKYRSDIADETDAVPLHQSAMWKRIAPFAAWLWASNLFHNLFEVADRYMLIHWSKTSADVAAGFVGQYHSGRVVPLLMVGIAAVVSGLLMPYMSAAWEKDDRPLACRQNNWSIKLMAVSFTAGGILVLLLAPLLFQGVFQGRYDDGLAVLPMTLVYCIWFALFTVGQNYLWVAEQGKWAAIAMMVGLSTNLLLNMILIPSYGLNGAVLATTSGNAVNLIILYVCNTYYGCPTDRGIWLLSMVPLSLLLPLPAASIVMLIAAGVMWRTDWLLSREEKVEIKNLVASRFNKS